MSKEKNDLGAITREDLRAAFSLLDREKAKEQRSSYLIFKAKDIAGECDVVPLHEALRMERVVKAMIAEPYGCAFCDSGKLRNPEKDHDANCAWKLAKEALKP